MATKLNKQSLELLFGNMPVVETSTGLLLANFSSPHSFQFTDGTILPACTNDWSRGNAMNIREIPVSARKQQHDHFETIELVTMLTPAVAQACEAALLAQQRRLVDVVIVPLMVLTQLHEVYEKGSYEWADDRNIYASPFRTVRMADRVTKVAHHDKFCI